MKTYNVLKAVGLGMVIGASAAYNASAIVSYANAFDTSISAGNQTGGPYNIGQQFTVNVPSVTVAALGAFDSGLNGFGSDTITVSIYNSVGAALATETFTGTQGTLGDTANPSSPYRFENLGTPLVLSSGTYMIVASGLGDNANPDYNTFGNLTPIQNNPGGSELSFGGNYYSYGSTPAEPGIADGNQIGKYGAGTFEFTAVPEVQTFAVAGVGMLGLVFIGRKLATRAV